MPLAEDASTPAVVTGSGQAAATTAAFSPPAGSLLVVLVGGGWSNTTMSVTITDSSGKTWTTAANAASSFGGVVKIAYFYFVSAPGSITVTATYANFGSGGGRILGARVLTGASPNQSGAVVTVVDPGTLITAATVSITTTATGSRVYGASNMNNVGTTHAPNGSTTEISDYNASSSTLTLWRATALTGTPGAIVLGGTWGTAGGTNIVAFEVLPIPPFIAQPNKIPNSAARAVNRSYSY